MNFLKIFKNRLFFYLNMIFFVFAISFLVVSCGQENLNNSGGMSAGQDTSVNSITGEWSGYLVSAESDKKSDNNSDGNYTLYITRTENYLNGFLTVPDNNGSCFRISLSGYINDNNEVNLTGIFKNSEIRIYGVLNEDKTLKLVINGLQTNIQYLLMYRQKDLANMVTASFHNVYKLELKLGKIGRGRSIILVHGMDDNAKTWNEFLDYLKKEGIGKKNNVWIFEYRWWNHIDYNGRVMYSLIDDKQINGEISKEPIIIAHSMGGLVCRFYILLGGDFYRLVTLSTPHLGSKLAHFVPFGGEDGVGDLLPGHKFLNKLNSDEYEKKQRHKYWLLNGRVGTYRSCCVGSHCFCYHWHKPKPTYLEKIGHSRLHKPNDGMVTNASARFEGNDYYKADNSVHRVDTFFWIDHKRLNKEKRVFIWLKHFIENHE